MKIAFIFPTLISCGPVRQTYYLLSGLCELGFEVDLFVFNRSAHSEELLEKFTALGIRVHLFQVNVVDIFRSRRLMRSIKPDIVHSTLMLADLIAFFIATDVPRIITHRTDPNDHLSTKGMIFGNIFFYITKFLSSRAHASVCVSRSIQKRLARYSVRSTDVIENCVPITTLNYPVRNIQGLPKIINILVIGSLCGRKNPIRSLEYAIGLSDFLDNSFFINVYFLGDGEYKETILSHPLSSNMKVYCPGHVDIRPYLEKATLHISSSFAEGMPNSVLETMSLGIPNVLSNIPEHVEFSEFENKLLMYFRYDVPFSKNDYLRLVRLFEVVSPSEVIHFKQKYSYKNVAAGYDAIYSNLT